MRKYTKFIMLFLSLTLVFVLAACGDKVELSFVNEPETVIVGDKIQLEYKLSDESLSLEWSVDDETLAEINQTGYFIALKAGEVSVTVKIKDSDVAATIKITIEAVPEVVPISVVVSNNPEQAKVGENVKLKANVLPAGAKQEVTWKSSDESVATVNAEGNVSFLSVGKVTITATVKAKDTLKHSVTIDVVAPDPTEIVVTTESGEAEVMLYATIQMVATVNPDIAVDTVTWSVSDSQIAVINENGKLEGKKVGFVTVTATSTVNEQVFGTKEIEVVQPKPTSLEVTGPHKIIQEKEEMQLVVKVLPDLASKDVTFTSSDNTIATVDSTGKVVGVKAGEVTITVKSAVEENLTRTYEITVVEEVSTPDHVNFLVDASLKDADRFTKVTLDGKDYILGLNAFSDFANFALSNESEIFVKPGTYEGSILVNKNNVLIYSENKDKDPNTSAFGLQKQAILKGKILIEDAVEGLTINGLSFTETGKVEAKATVNEFSFLNNNIFDTIEPKVNWNPLRDYNLIGVVTLWKQGKAVKDILIANNRFYNVPETNIVIGNTHGIDIKDNTFTNFELDAIRIEGGYNYLTTTIERNKFENDELGGHNGIYFRAIGDDGLVEANKNIIVVKDNYFKNIGLPKDFSGALSTSVYQENGAEIYITHNTFVSSLNYIWLRVNVSQANLTKYGWTGVINHNVFLGLPQNYYHKSKNPSDTDTTNPPLVNMDYNFFGDLDGNPVDLDSEEIKALFQSVGSLNHSFKSIEAMTAMMVNKEWEGTADKEDVTYDGMKFIYGENAFSNITDAMEAVKSGGVIIVLPGEYDTDVDITKPVTLMTPNARVNPTEDDSDFALDSDSAVIIKKPFYFSSVSNITIKGFTFTEDARIRQYGPELTAGTSNFAFENNYVVDTKKASIAWQQAAYQAYGTANKEDATIPGFITLAQQYTWMANTKLINNKFENVSDTHLHIIAGANATITGNHFLGGDRDAIRLDYGSLYGDFYIKDNVFKDLKYNGIYIRTYAVSWAAVRFHIENNIFENLGDAGKTETPGNTRIGAISSAFFSEANDATFNIKYNVFKNNVNYISLRNNVSNVNTWATKGLVWRANIEYNAFIDSDDVDYYFRNLLGPNDTKDTNVNNIFLNNNFYGSDENTKVDITPEQFDHHLEDESNKVVYNSLAELETGIEDYLEFIKPIIVDPELAEEDTGTKVIYDGVELEVGISAFASLAEAVENAVAGKVIKVLPGTYKETEVVVKVDGLRIYGPNANINPMTGTRVEEAILQIKLKIDKDVKDTVINGFSLDYVSATSYVLGHEDGGIDGFEFSYNILNGSSGGGGEGVLRFVQKDATKGNKNFNLNYNLVRNVGSDRGFRLAFIENINIIGNKFDSNTTDAIRINDNGGSATGTLVMKDNTFVKTGQFALFLGATTIERIEITGNTFNESGNVYAGGALSIRKLTAHENGTTVIISNNNFNGPKSTDIRVDHEETDSTKISITVDKNNFYVADNQIYTTSGTGTVKALFKLDNKVFDAEGEEIALSTLFEGDQPKVSGAELEAQ